MRHVALAVAFVLIGATDYDPHVLIERGHVAPLACATSLATCEAAVDAIHAGRWRVTGRDADLSCKRRSCFAPRELCIKGYDCR